MRIFHDLHWLVPWLILAVGLYTTIRLVRGYVDNRAFADDYHRLVAIFSGLLDLQATTGLIYFLWDGAAGKGFPVYRVLHGLFMFGAALVPHVSNRWKSAADSARYLHNFYLLLASFIRMLMGISLIPAWPQMIILHYEHR